MAEDTITDRGFRHTEPVAAVNGYPGSIKVYESSAATAPRVWISAEDEDGDTTVHLDVDDALMFAENIIRVCRLHYQRRDDGD